ncbi:MAG TPA: hypothetical protein VNF51_01700 [Candidatus Paceibacterota bacterium]|nr:hypothetical protein [Candidatus Paceibacterota bacterium]
MSFAEYIGSGTTGIIGVLNVIIIPLILALAFAVFIWGIVKYFFLGGADETKRGEGRTFVFWGLIGLVVLFSVWGFLNILLSTLGLA